MVGRLYAGHLFAQIYGYLFRLNFHCKWWILKDMAIATPKAVKQALHDRD